MAATSVLRLKVDDKEYNASLRQAQQGMQHLEQALQTAGKTFAQVDKSVVEYARAIGQMETQSKTARGKIGEMSSAFVELSTQYNKMSAEMKNTDVGRALAQSMDELRQRTVAAKQELQQLNAQLVETKVPDMDASGGSMLSGLGGKFSGAMQVFAGNVLTKAAGAVANLGTEMMGLVQQGVELARQGEGIRNAFERLGRGDILDGLRQATHGTVTDIELMKAAVKFNDFKLPLNELGTMLAFAQQKAKDTGQSVDYMVDSIVTGLGRKSLMILDNLGLSATEVKERMAETGDMTKAVGDIIREQMAKAGDYVETAADRAAQANVNLQNKMEELGRKFAPLEEASSQLWTSMKIGIMDIIGGPLTDLLNKLTEAGRMASAYGVLGGNAKVGRMTANLSSAREENRQSIYQQQQQQFWRYINPREQQIKDIRAWQSGQRGEALQGRINAITDKYGSLDTTKIQAEVDAAKKMLADYQSAAKQILQPIKQEITPATTTSGGATGGTTRTVTKVTPEEIIPEGSVAALTKQMQELQKEQQKVTSSGDWQKYQQQIDEIANRIKTIRDGVREGLKPVDVKTLSTGTGGNRAEAALSGFADMRKQMQVDIDLSNAKIDETTMTNLLRESMQRGLNDAAVNLEFAAIQQKMADGMNIPDETWEALQTEINEKLARLGIEPISIDFKTGDVKEMTKDWKGAASAIQSVGSAMSQIEDPAAKVMGTIAQAIATIALTFASSLKGTVTPWDWIAAAAAGTATMISTISAIHSATGYAEGGVIKGNSYSGDNIGGLVDGSQLVGLNAGEIVLNASQQSMVAQNLQSTGGTARLSATVSGEQIVLAANRYLRRSGQGELVTWK